MLGWVSVWWVYGWLDVCLVGVRVAGCLFGGCLGGWVSVWWMFDIYVYI